TEALTEVMGWLFDQLGRHRLFAHADDRNHGVHRLFDRVGLRPEARFIDADWFKGEWTTLRVYALLRKEWGARRR
ncbi:MAG: GNAT family N-acetyltransferase, partial [Actinomycetota bacterium]|nr:GNAT family N-acetyltransferase [Actinomycetota bacterium]